MSGRKESEFRLQRERAEKLQSLQSLSNLRGEVGGLEERVTAMLDEASGGLRATFAGEVQKAQGWLRQLNPPDISQLGMHSRLATLRTTQRELAQMAAQARQVQEELMLAFTQKADAMGQRLAKRLAEVTGRHISRQELLSLWCAEGQIEGWQQTLQIARRLLDSEQYAALEKRLDEFERSLARHVKWAEEQEDKHQKRLYLLKGLRQVCTEMGFEEVSSPRYERQGDRGSRILYEVDTLDRGQIAFTLSLDTISTFAEAAENHCFVEFGQLSHYLEEGFGIQTQFRMADGQPLPKLIRKGEKDLPEDSGMYAQA